MLRRTHLENLPWADKTCTGLRDLVIEEAEAELNRVPDVNLFDEPDETQAMELYRFSYAAIENGRRPVTSEALRRDVLLQLQNEFRVISQEEYELLAMLAANSGMIPLADRNYYPAALSLIKRLWCTVIRDDKGFSLLLHETVVDLMEKALTMPEFIQWREHMHGMEQVLRAALYINGVMDMDTALMLVTPVLLRDMPVSPRLIRRFMIAEFDCSRDEDGRFWLLHPGAADSDSMIRSTRNDNGRYVLPDPMMLPVLCRDGVLPSEKKESDLLTASLDGAVRPEYTSPNVSEDIRLLLKQNVPMDDVMKALAGCLSVRPTRRMTDCVHELRRVTMLWGKNKTTAVMQ